MTFEANAPQPAAAVHLPRLNPLPKKSYPPRRACVTPVAGSSSSASLAGNDKGPSCGESFNAVMFWHLPQSQPFPAASTEQSTLPRQPRRDDICTKYYPHAGRPIEVKSFEDYGHTQQKPPSPRTTMPWLPFHSESEFSFAEIVLESAMSNGQVDALIGVIHRLVKDKEAFLVRNHGELEKLWIGASR